MSGAGRPAAHAIKLIEEPGLLALAYQGAVVLAAHGYPEVLKRDWTELNRELSRFSPMIPHMLDLAAVKVAFRKVVADLPGLTLSANGRERPVAIPSGLSADHQGFP